MGRLEYHIQISVAHPVPGGKGGAEQTFSPSSANPTAATSFDEEVFNASAVTPTTLNSDSEQTTSGARKFVIGRGLDGSYQQKRSILLGKGLDGSYKPLLTIALSTTNVSHGSYLPNIYGVNPEVWNGQRQGFMSGVVKPTSGSRNTEVTTSGARKFVISNVSGVLDHGSYPIKSGLLLRHPGSILPVPNPPQF